jgi:hypothetical protein
MNNVTLIYQETGCVVRYSSWKDAIQSLSNLVKWKASERAVSNFIFRDPYLVTDAMDEFYHLTR